MQVKKMIAKGVRWYMKHDRTILKGVSMAATVVAVVEAWRIRPKCEQILIEANEEGVSNAEKMKRLAPEIAKPGIALGVALVTSAVEYKGTGKKLATAIDAASSYKTINDIRREVEREHLTEEKAKEIETEVAKKRLETVPDKEVKETGHGKVKFEEHVYSGNVWHGSRDQWELAVEKCNSKLRACYDRYGLCRKDDFAQSIKDLFRNLRMDCPDMCDNYVYQAIEYDHIPVVLVPVEFDTADGGKELGYQVVFEKEPTMAYSDSLGG